MKRTVLADVGSAQDKLHSPLHQIYYLIQPMIVHFGSHITKISPLKVEKNAIKFARVFAGVCGRKAGFGYLPTGWRLDFFIGDA